MSKIIQRVTITALFLLFIPFIAYLSHWTWYPEIDINLLHIMFCITQTITSPWVILTHILLCTCMIIWGLRFSRLKSVIFFVITINAIVGIGQYTKFYIKEQMQVPRPYVVWLQKKYGVNQEQFYKKNKKKRSEIIFTILSHKHLPQYVINHWASDTGFSFPSGHTIFSSSWALFIIGVLWDRKHVSMIIILLLWVMLVMLSRLFLCMHWPQDLMMSIFVSWFVVIIGIWSIKKHIAFNRNSI